MTKVLLFKKIIFKATWVQKGDLHVELQVEFHRNTLNKFGTSMVNLATVFISEECSNKFANSIGSIKNVHKGLPYGSVFVF